MNWPHVRIAMPHGSASVMGTKIEVDGVEQRMVRKATLVLETGEVATLTLEQFAHVVFDGVAQVDTSIICPSCRKEITRHSGSELGPLTVETTTLDDEFVRRSLVE